MIKKLWLKFKEYILYLVFGGLTTVVNYAVFILLDKVAGMTPVLSNSLAWIAAVAFAYVTNRIWVFESKASGFKNILKEILEFVAGRLITLGIENLMLWIFVDILHANELIIKVIASVVTIILNYVFSKFIIFKKSEHVKN